MTDKQLKKLSRAELLELLISQTQRLDETEALLSETQKMLQKREIAIESSGSIAEASLKLNDVFRSADAAAQQYIENIRLMQEQEKQIYDQITAKANADAENIIAQAENKSAEILEEARLEYKKKMSEAYNKIKKTYQKLIAIAENMNLPIQTMTELDRSEHDEIEKITDTHSGSGG